MDAPSIAPRDDQWRVTAQQELEWALLRAKRRPAPPIASDFIFLLAVPRDEFDDVIVRVRAALAACVSRTHWLAFITRMEAAYPQAPWVMMEDDDEDDADWNEDFRILTTPSVSRSFPPTTSPTRKASTVA